MLQGNSTSFTAKGHSILNGKAVHCICFYPEWKIWLWLSSVQEPQIILSSVVVSLNQNFPKFRHFFINMLEGEKNQSFEVFFKLKKLRNKNGQVSPYRQGVWVLSSLQPYVFNHVLTTHLNFPFLFSDRRLIFNRCMASRYTSVLSIMHITFEFSQGTSLGILFQFLFDKNLPKFTHL